MKILRCSSSRSRWLLRHLHSPGLTTPRKIQDQDEQSEWSCQSNQINQQKGMNMKKYVLSVLLGISASFLPFLSHAANPLDSAGGFYNLCANRYLVDDSIEQTVCMTYLMGVMRGYQVGVPMGLNYVRGQVGVTPDGEAFTPEMLTKFGEAARLGVVDGYCRTESKPILDDLKTVMNYIRTHPGERNTKAQIVIMKALREAYPSCPRQ